VFVEIFKTMKRTSGQGIILLLPPWLPENIWEEFLKHRRRISKPLTDYGQCLAIQELDKLREAGQDPVAVVNQTILLGWAGLFAIDERKNGNGRKENSTESVLRRLHESDAGELPPN
jgi:hypothetical protein